MTPEQIRGYEYPGVYGLPPPQHCHLGHEHCNLHTTPELHRRVYRDDESEFETPQFKGAENLPEDKLSRIREIRRHPVSVTDDQLDALPYWRVARPRITWAQLAVSVAIALVVGCAVGHWVPHPFGMP